MVPVRVVKFQVQSTRRPTYSVFPENAPRTAASHVSQTIVSPITGRKCVPNDHFCFSVRRASGDFIMGIQRRRASYRLFVKPRRGAGIDSRNSNSPLVNLFINSAGILIPRINQIIYVPIIFAGFFEPLVVNNIPYFASSCFDAESL